LSRSKAGTCALPFSAIVCEACALAAVALIHCALCRVVSWQVGSVARASSHGKPTRPCCPLCWLL
jgi:hypothetical protein